MPLNTLDETYKHSISGHPTPALVVRSAQSPSVCHVETVNPMAPQDFIPFV